jgi:UDP-N-acetyl-2-amino-2-deoxyglucuronate dehydrogenase
MTAVGLGIAGTGRWAGAHARAAARSDDVSIVHCVSRTEERRSAFAAEHGIARHSASLGEMLQDPAVDAVVLATPNDVHVAMALEVLAAGKPMLIDKPVSISVRQGLQLLGAAGFDNGSIGVAHHPRLLAGQRYAKNWIDGEASGRVRMAYGTFSNARGGAMRPDAWHRRVEGAEAGVLIQVGLHSVDTLLWLLGPATEVAARFAHETLGSDMPDAATVQLVHASGALSVVSTSWTTPSHYGLDLHATGGNLVYRLDHAQWTSADVDAHAELVLEHDGLPDERVTPPAGDPLQDQLNRLAEAVHGDVPVGVTVEEGLQSVAVVEAAVESSRTGAIVALTDLYERSGAVPEQIDRLVGRQH